MVGPAPSDAGYVVITADPLLTGEFDLSTLGSGMLKQTVAGVVAHPAIAIPGVDYDVPRFVQVVVLQDTPAYSILTTSGFIADSSNMVYFGRVLGMVETFYPNGSMANVITDLDITNNTWSWSPNSRLYLNGTSISASPPVTGFSQRVAVAINANIISMGLQPPVQL